MENKRKISAKIVADSIDSRGNRITTFVLTYPRMIHAELLTHRLFSRNAASSRAIPFKKMVEDVENDPFVPIAWQKDHKGMQGVEYITDKDEILSCVDVWIAAKDTAIEYAKTLNHSLEATKQLCNRLLEPFQWYTCLVTATEFDNFYELRCPKYYYEPENLYFKSRKDWISEWDSCFEESIHYTWSEEDWWQLSESGAEIHIQALAEAMWDAQNESKPNELKAGEWHIPFGDRINATFIMNNKDFMLSESKAQYSEIFTNNIIKIATARCARLSYMTFDGEIDYEKDIKLHNQLLESKHYSPFEHCCRVMNSEEYESFYKGRLYKKHLTTSGTGRYSSDEEWEVWEKDSDYDDGWCNNIKGFIQYRSLLENE